ncbi:MAG: hypothetical protein OSJ71_02560, partial [Acetatifactor sp.]|nr:hypothetical protein [Acetatifactor sp.]
DERSDSGNRKVYAALPVVLASSPTNQTPSQLEGLAIYEFDERSDSGNRKVYAALPVVFVYSPPHPKRRLPCHLPYMKS